MAEQASSSTSSSTPSAGSAEPITLRITTLDTRILSVSVPLQETVLQLKERLAVLLQVPSPRQRLIFQGRLLRDEDCLNDYGMALFSFISPSCSCHSTLSLAKCRETTCYMLRWWGTHCGFVSYGWMYLSS